MNNWKFNVTITDLFNDQEQTINLENIGKQEVDEQKEILKKMVDLTDEELEQAQLYAKVTISRKVIETK